jgi:hypothetical protein
MKKIISIFCLLSIVLVAEAQMSRADQLKSLEQNSSNNQNINQLQNNSDQEMTATLKSAARLFGAKDDLTTVIMIIPSGSTVAVLGSDSTYYKVQFEENEGYILKRQAVIDNSPAQKKQSSASEAGNQEQVTQNRNRPVAQQDQQSRFSYLEDKYGSAMAARLNAGKIWKGMSAEMVKDSWGSPQKINRVINGNTMNEEWTYKSTRLYLENNKLIDWGPVRR